MASPTPDVFTNPEALLTLLFRSFYGGFITYTGFIKLLAIGDQCSFQPRAHPHKLESRLKSSNLLIRAWSSWHPAPILRLSRGLPITFIAHEISQVLGALCQEIRTKTSVIC